MTDSPSIATADQLFPMSADATDVTDPHQSKVSLDDPRLKLPRARSRILRRGPAIAVASAMAVVAGIGIILALNPQSPTPPKDEPAAPETSLAPNLPIADAIKNGPGNNAPVFAAATNPASSIPRLGEPLSGQEGPPSSAPANGMPSVADQRRLERAGALNKARSSGLFLGGDETPAGERPSGPAVQSAGPPQRLLASLQGESPSAGRPRPALGQQDPNLQDRKNEFLGGEGASDANYLQHTVSRPRSPYEVKAGTVIPTVLLTGLNSDLPGEVIGQVRESVYDSVTGTHLLIPQGSRLLAQYDSMVAFGQERALVCWNRLIRPDGSSVNLECMPGVDLAGYAGFSDGVDHHWWRILSGVALGSLLAATAARSQGDVQSLQPSFPQLWASNAGAQINQAGQQITQRNLAVQPTITVGPGYSVNVLVSKDIVLPPYGAGE
jgi:type IV secretory pathway VirB10-like protein